MASDTGVPREGLDERLAAARDSVLNEGEKIVAQEEGDQGQGIILTNSRVLVIKVGITATGTPKGSIIGQFPLADITSVNVRKGPLGGVIHVCVDRAEAAPTPGTPPDNVVVFTGSQRMKKCDAVAALIERALGKPVSRKEKTPSEPSTAPEETQPAPTMEAEEVAAEPVEDATALEDIFSEPPPPEAEPEADRPPERRRGGRRQPVSLADEIFADMTGGRQEAAAAEPVSPVAEPLPEPSVQTAPPPVPEPMPEPTPVMAVEEQEEAELEDDEEPVEYAPNPNLPAPVRRSRGRERVLVLFGSLIAVLIVGIAVTAPMRVKKQLPTVSVPAGTVKNDPRVLRSQMAGVADYLTLCRGTVQGTEAYLARFDAALRTGGKAAVAAAAKESTVDQAWRKLDRLKPPRGLAGAREQMVSGLFIAKNAVANVSGAVDSSAELNAAEALDRTREARLLMQKGLAAVAAMQADLERQIRKPRPKPASAKPAN